jgi:hypothetical protein
MAAMFALILIDRLAVTEADAGDDAAVDLAEGAAWAACAGEVNCGARATVPVVVPVEPVVVVLLEPPVLGDPSGVVESEPLVGASSVLSPRIPDSLKSLSGCPVVGAVGPSAWWLARPSLVSATAATADPQMQRTAAIANSTGVRRSTALDAGSARWRGVARVARVKTYGPSC